MSRKTSQLQIRVSPEQKASLKRLAAEAGLNVSQYVLSVVLPSTQAEFAGLAEELRDPETRRAGLARLTTFLAELPGEDVGRAIADLATGAFPPLVQRYLAGVVEEEAGVRGLDPPRWAESVGPLDQPHFAWSARSLWPHLMRITPVAFKRRNLFVDAAGVESGGTRRARTGPELDRTLVSLRSLDRALARRGAEVEACRAAGAVVCVAFSADPATRAIGALFRPLATLDDACREVAAGLGLEDRWLGDAVRARLGSLGESGAVELPHVRVFSPPAEYLLAMRCAALAQDDDPRHPADIRFLLRLLDLSVREDALEVVHRYFNERQLPADLGDVLAGLLAAT